MRWRAASLVIAVFVLASCSSELGRRVPWCDDLNATTILSAQAVAGAGYLPCLNDLKPGWTYEHLEAERGRSRFWLTSDRVGTRFLEVSLGKSCDPGDATQVVSDEPNAALFTRIDIADFSLPITIVPEGTGTANRSYALELADQLSGAVLVGREVRIRIDAGDDPTESRITRAVAEQRPVLVVGTREQEERTIELHLPRPGSDADPLVFSGIPLSRGLYEIEERLGHPRYRATWYYVFDSGCVTYEFDAKGTGVAAIPGDVRAAIGLLPLAEPRRILEEQGRVVP